jgi:hypothetical protein
MNAQQIDDDHKRIRREVLTRRILYSLRSTIQLRGKWPETPVHDVIVDFTDKSAAYVAPLIEAIDILEAIIFASDGCVGHRECAHSMEPWQRARALLQGKWEADNGERETWPDVDESHESEPRDFSDLNEDHEG